MGPVDVVALKAQSSVAPPVFNMQPLAPWTGEMTVNTAVRPVVTVSVAVRVPANVPVMTTGVEAGTVPVVIVNDVLVLPLGTVTLAGTTTRVGLALDSVTTAPPDPAARVRVAVP